MREKLDYGCARRPAEEGDGDMRRIMLYRLRPNLLHIENSCWYILLPVILLFPWRSNRSASVHATVNVLLFLLRRFQYL